MRLELFITFGGQQKNALFLNDNGWRALSERKRSHRTMLWFLFLFGSFYSNEANSNNNVKQRQIEIQEQHKRCTAHRQPAIRKQKMKKISVIKSQAGTTNEPTMFNCFFLELLFVLIVKFSVCFHLVWFTWISVCLSHIWCSFLWGRSFFFISSLHCMSSIFSATEWK